jgi:hypothetical protein
MVFLRNISVDTLHKGDTEDKNNNNNNNNNNINNTKDDGINNDDDKNMYMQFIQFYWTTSHSHIRDPVYQPITKIDLYFSVINCYLFRACMRSTTQLVGSEGSAEETYA